MSAHQPDRLALGTAQFGLPYGIGNRIGQVSRAEAAEILREARAAGVDTLDTAVAYGESEACLGSVGVAGWQVISKLPRIPEVCSDISAWVHAEVSASLQRLQLDQLTGLLLHHPPDLFGAQGDALVGALRSLQAHGLIGRLGVSVYDPEELGPILERFPVEIVQAPFNVIDRRLITSGWIERLAERGIIVHVRSIFLQGLLLMNPDTRPEQFVRWQSLWQEWSRWLADQKLTPVEACVGFALAQPGIDRVVVGVDGIGHLRGILASLSARRAPPPLSLECADIDLINPSRWLKPSVASKAGV